MSAGTAWTARNGSAPATPVIPTAPPPRRNGCRPDPYANLMHKLPPAGAKKVKTTTELLEQIQSRSAVTAITSGPGSPEVLCVDSPPPTARQRSPSPDVMVVASPMRNGAESPPRQPHVFFEAEAEAAEPYPPCTCDLDSPDPTCAAATRLSEATPRSVFTLHHALVPGVNGTRAPALPHPHAVRTAADPTTSGLFATVVPLYRYTDYADDYCVKNLSRVELCPSVPQNEFAPTPPPPPTPPSPLPRPVTSPESDNADTSDIIGDGPVSDDYVKSAHETDDLILDSVTKSEVDSERGTEDGDRRDEESERGRGDSENEQCASEIFSVIPAESEADKTETGKMRKETSDLDGRTLYRYWQQARSAATLGYSSAYSAPVVAWSWDERTCEEIFLSAETETRRDEFGRPARPERFAEWHEPARLTEDLIALPYVVID